MSINNKTIVFFLTLIFLLFIFSEPSKCNELITNNSGIGLQKEEINNQNIIVRKYISEKYTVNSNIIKLKFSFEVYPNPTFSDEINISFKDNSIKISEIKLYNLNSFKSLNSDSFLYLDNSIKFLRIEKGKYLISVFLQNGECYSKIFLVE